MKKWVSMSLVISIGIVMMGCGNVHMGEDAAVVIEGDSLSDMESDSLLDMESDNLSDMESDSFADIEDSSFVNMESDSRSGIENVVDKPGRIGETAGDEETFDRIYEYYLTKEEVIRDIEQGYVFRMDKTFEETAMPTVTGGNWFFHVNEDNTLNLEIAFSNLFERPKSEADWGWNVDKTGSKEISVSLISPDGQNIYNFSKKGKEIMENTAVQKQIQVTPGEWNLQVSFSYFSHGGETPSNLFIAAAYENPSEEDIRWLKDARLNQ